MRANYALAENAISAAITPPYTHNAAHCYTEERETVSAYDIEVVPLYPQPTFLSNTCKYSCRKYTLYRYVYNTINQKILKVYSRLS